MMRLFTITLISIFLIFARVNYAQTLKLTKIKSGKEVLIKEGSRVGYKTKQDFFLKGGNVHILNDSSIQVNDRAIILKKIKYFGIRKKGSTGLTILTAALSGFSLGFTLNSNSSTVRAIGILRAASFYGVSFYIGEKNKPRNLKKKWKLEVIQ